MNTRNTYPLLFSFCICVFAPTLVRAENAAGGGSTGVSGAPALGPIDKTPTNSHRRGEEKVSASGSVVSAGETSESETDRDKRVVNENQSGASRMTDAMSEHTKSDLARQKSGFPAR